MWVSTNQTNGNPRLTTRSKNPNPSPLEKICLTHNSSTSSVDDRVGRVCQGLCNRSTDEGAMGAARLALAKAAEAACPGTGEHTVLDAAATVGNFAAVSQLVDFTGHQNGAALVKGVQTIASVVSCARRIRGVVPAPLRCFRRGNGKGKVAKTVGQSASKSSEGNADGCSSAGAAHSRERFHGHYRNDTSILNGQVVDLPAKFKFPSFDT